MSKNHHQKPNQQQANIKERFQNQYILIKETNILTGYVFGLGDYLTKYGKYIAPSHPRYWVG
jgi:hypothetical protein